ncbi:parB-like partition protein, partial [Acidithiobacillus sp. GGI-221]
MKESLLKGINLDAARAALQAAPDGSNTNLVALYLSLDNIEPDPNQPRRSLEAGEGGQSLEELADSILQHGVLQPITVEANGQGKYRIVAGERRWRAAMIARDRGSPAPERITISSASPPSSPTRRIRRIAWRCSWWRIWPVPIWRDTDIRRRP